MGTAANPVDGSACPREFPIGEPVIGFTELSPALLAMEAERLGLPDAIRNPELLRRQIYLQMRQQAPVHGPAPATDE